MEWCSLRSTTPFSVREGNCLDVYCRIHEIHVPAVEFLPKELDCFAKSLEMNDFTLPKEFDHIVHIRVIAEP